MVVGGVQYLAFCDVGEDGNHPRWDRVVVEQRGQRELDKDIKPQLRSCSKLCLKIAVPLYAGDCSLQGRLFLFPAQYRNTYTQQLFLRVFISRLSSLVAARDVA